MKTGAWQLIKLKNLTVLQPKIVSLDMCGCICQTLQAWLLFRISWLQYI